MLHFGLGSHALAHATAAHVAELNAVDHKPTGILPKSGAEAGVREYVVEWKPSGDSPTYS